MKQLISNIAIQLFFLSVLTSQLTINVKVPTSTPQGDIYLAGNFNTWNPKSEAYKLIKKEALLYTIDINPAKGNLEFKFTRGSWVNPEGTALGGYIPNRTYNYDGKTETIDLEIMGWEDIKEATSTASKNVAIDNSNFYMKSLNRYRKIWIYLPPDYTASSKNYPVIYMHDGQNLFDKKTSFADEWQVDETLDKLYANGKEVAIVVGIENGGSERLNEYSPWVNATYGGGDGDKYLTFITEELKPYIDAKYRTKKDQASTAMIGSSMGGLISIYAAIKYSEIFGKIAPLSTSYWFSQKVYDYAASKKYNEVNQKMYLIAGGKEGGSQVADMYKMRDILTFNGLDENKIKTIDHPLQGHNEAYWASQFENIFTWLFNNETNAVEEKENIKYSFIQDSNTIYYKGGLCNECMIHVINIAGQEIYTGELEEDWQMKKNSILGLNKFSIEQKGKVVYTQTLFAE